MFKQHSTFFFFSISLDVFICIFKLRHGFSQQFSHAVHVCWRLDWNILLVWTATKWRLFPHKSLPITHSRWNEVLPGGTLKAAAWCSVLSFQNRPNKGKWARGLREKVSNKKINTALMQFQCHLGLRNRWMTGPRCCNSRIKFPA